MPVKSRLGGLHRLTKAVDSEAASMQSESRSVILKVKVSVFLIPVACDDYCRSARDQRPCGQDTWCATCPRMSRRDRHKMGFQPFPYFLGTQEKTKDFVWSCRSHP